jgi:hypothetical protein
MHTITVLFQEKIRLAKSILSTARICQGVGEKSQPSNAVGFQGFEVGPFESFTFSAPEYGVMHTAMVGDQCILILNRSRHQIYSRLDC